MANNRRTLNAAAPAFPKEVRFTGAASIDLTAAAPAGDGQAAKQATFSMVAYTGDDVWADGWDGPVYLDLKGLILRDNPPALLHHNVNEIVGQCNVVTKTATQLKASGIVTATTGKAAEVVTHSQNGFKWSSSVGVGARSREWVEAGAKAQVNGKTVKGPCTIIRVGMLNEISFACAGGDNKATAKIAALAATGDGVMTYEQWLASLHMEASAITTEQDTAFRAQFKAFTDLQAKAAADPNGGNPAVPPPAPAPAPAAPPLVNIHAASRAETAAEFRRVDEIRALCGQDNLTLAAEAVEKGWSKNDTELALLRAGMPTRQGMQGQRPNEQKKAEEMEILQACVRMTCPDARPALEAQYKNTNGRILEEAKKRRITSLRGLVEACCKIEGKSQPAIDDNIGDWVRAAFSTTSLPTTLGSAANKILLDAYTAAPSVARQICKTLTANDFKTHTGIRVVGDGTFQKVGQDGELKFFNLGEQTFPFIVDTYGRMIGLTRQQWINDDLSAFSSLVHIIGQGAFYAVEEALWTLLIANTGTFFGSGNGNYIEGADTNLGIPGLDSAFQKMLEQKSPSDAGSKPIVVDPRFLLVPPALAGESNRVDKSDYLVATGIGSTAKLVPSANTYKGRLTPLVSRWLTAAKVWYLFADPAVAAAAFGIAFLKGNDSPVIEQVEQSPEYLGYLWRGYIDFGVCQLDPRGAVMSKGEA